MSRRTREQWRRDVFATTDPRMTASVKVLCLYLADHMDAERHVSLPRDVMANALSVHPQRIAERLTKAIEAEFLLRVRVGKPGWTAEFQGCWPDVISGREPRNCGVVRTAPQDAIRTAPQDALSEPRRAVRTPEGEPTNGAGERTALRDASKGPLPSGPPRTPRSTRVQTKDAEEAGAGWVDVDRHLGRDAG